MDPICATVSIGVIDRLAEWREGDELTASHLNEINGAFSRLTSIHPPKTINRPGEPGVGASSNFPIGGVYVLQRLPTAGEQPLAIEQWNEGDEISAARLQQEVDNVRLVTKSTRYIDPPAVPTYNPLVVSSNPEPDYEPVPKNTFIGMLDDWKADDVLSAEHLNQPVAILNAVYGGVQPPLQMSRKGYFAEP